MKNDKIVICQNCKHRPTNVERYSNFPASMLNFPDDVCPLQCKENNYFNIWVGYDFFCGKGELDKEAVCKNCKYFHTEYYDYSDIRISTRNFCYAVREKEEVHPFGKACEAFKKRKDNE